MPQFQYRMTYRTIKAPPPVSVAQMNSCSGKGYSAAVPGIGERDVPRPSYFG